MQYTAVTLAARPAETITPECFEVVQRETPTLRDGRILLRQTHMSLDPAMRGWMNDDKGSYIPPVGKG